MVIHMVQPLILASGSTIRATLLRNAGVSFTTQIARVDEEMIRRSLEAEQASPRDVADALAELKAQKVAQKNDSALVLGCDQVLSFDRKIVSKADTPDDAIDLLHQMRGKSHQLLVARNWDDIQHCVGCYQLEGEGARLFHRIEGDYFSVLGLPLLELLSYLTLRGTLDG